LGMTADDNIPDYFDSNETWPGMIGDIRDQGQCGSCWAFSAAEALSDRFAIQTGEVVTLSPQFLVSCDYSNDGCGGGNLDLVWRYLKSHGTVADDCMTYVSGTSATCPDNCFEPDCPNTCEDGSALEMYKAANVRDISRMQDMIKTE
ncbi:peptidase C1A, partial [Kipferlia bialata]